MATKKNKPRNKWARPRGGVKHPREILSGARNLKELLDLAGLSVDDDYAKTMLFLQAIGRDDLLEKLKQPLALQAAERVVQGRVFSVRTKPCDGEILLGTSTDLSEDGVQVRLPVKNFNLHCGIFGSTGQGKTHMVKWLVTQLIQQGVVVWVFDLEGEFSCLLPCFTRDQLWWVKPSWIKLNPFQAVGDPKAWAGKITSLIRSIHYLKDGSAPLLSKILTQLYEERGCFRGTQNWPTLSDLSAVLARLNFAKTSRSAGYLESLMRCTTTMLDRLGSTLNVKRSMPITRLTNQSIIFDVTELDSQELEFFICLMLELSGKTPAPKKLRIIVIEEAHVLLNPQRQKREDLGEPPLQGALRRQRKRHTGFIVVDQAPGNLPDSVIANIGSKIVFPLTNWKCLQTVATSMGLDQDKAKTIPQLPTRTAAVQNQELGSALLVKVPEIKLPSPQDEAQTAAEMKPILASIPYTPVLEQKPIFENPSPQKQPGSPKPRAPGTASEAAADQPSTGSQKPPSRPSPAASQVTELVMASNPRGLSLETLKYLEQWNQTENQFLPVTTFDKKLGLSAAKGNTIRKKLQEAALIKVHTIKTGKRGSQVRTVEILKEGKEALKKMGVSLNPAEGKGGFLSQYWAAQICRFFEKTEPKARATIEQVRSGKAVDVAVEFDGKSTAYEINLTTNWASQNVVRDLLAGFDQVVFCAVSQDDLDKIKKKLERELGKEKEERELLESKVRFQQLKTFLL